MLGSVMLGVEGRSGGCGVADSAPLGRVGSAAAAAAASGTSAAVLACAQSAPELALLMAAAGAERASCRRACNSSQAQFIARPYTHEYASLCAIMRTNAHWLSSVLALTCRSMPACVQLLLGACVIEVYCCQGPDRR